MFTINRSQLIHALKLAFSVAADKSTHDLFTMVRLVTRDGRLFVQSTSGTAGLSLLFSGVYMGEIDLFVPSLFAEMVEKLTAEMLELVIKDGKLVIKAGKTKPTCAVMFPTEDNLALWPEFSQPPENLPLQVGARDLKRGLEVALQASNSNTPSEIQEAPHRGSVLIKAEAGALSVGGVHIYGLSRYLAENASEAREFILAALYAKKLLPLLKDEAQVSIFQRQNRVYYITNEAIFWTGVAGSNYPHYWRMIPAADKILETFEVDYVPLKEFLDTATSLHARNPEKTFFILELDKHRLKLSYAGETGQTEAEFEVPNAGTYRVGINLKSFANLYKRDMTFAFGTGMNGINILINAPQTLHLMSSFSL